MHTKGITTFEVTSLIEKKCGIYYMPTTISNITKATKEMIKEFLSRPLSKCYSVIYGDAT